jgi:2-polyprenyl-3-methyl-5-hydroxy-6-metoxy-1,4-benzoquinol methylase
MSASTPRSPSYLCPACRASVARQDAGYHCPQCGRTFPIICGIADFRLAPDRYLSLADERAKAERLHRFARDHSFAETVAEYYRITDDVPPAMAERYARNVLAGENRASEVLSTLVAGQGNLPMLDAGCGAGGLVVAAARAGHRISGLDIALRWLVIAAKRLEEEGLDVELVCADIAHPPFPEATFDAVAAIDLFEHLPDTAPGATALYQLLAPGGRLLATSANRHTLAPHPVAGLWGIGYLPAELRRRYVMARRGIDTLRYLQLLSPRMLKNCAKRAGFEQVRLDPLAVSPAIGGSALRRLAIGCYRALRTAPFTNRLLLHLGPVFQLTARKPVASISNQRNST